MLRLDLNSVKMPDLDWRLLQTGKGALEGIYYVTGYQPERILAIAHFIWCPKDDN